MLKRLPAISAILYALFSSAAQSQGEDWYTIEIIAFEYVNASDQSSETWPRDPGEPSLKNAIELTSESELALEFEFADSSTPAASSAPRAFRLLGRTELELTDVYRALKRTSNYRPIAHLAWRQPGYDEAHARPAHLVVPFALTEETNATFGELAPKLSGTIRLYRERYLHVDADLSYRLTGITHTTQTRHVPGTPFVVEELLAEEEFTQDVFRLHSQRRMRSAELHYLEHPMFGLLVNVTPFQPPKPQAEANVL